MQEHNANESELLAGRQEQQEEQVGDRNYTTSSRVRTTCNKAQTTGTTSKKS